MAIRILILEDHGLVRAGIEALLQILAPEAELAAAANCAQAVALLERQPFDVALLDIDLAGGPSGWDALAEMQRLQPGCRGVMLAAADDAETVLRSLDAGACGFIPKASEDTTVLAAALDTVLRGGVFLPPSVLTSPAADVSCQPAAQVPVLTERLTDVLYHLCQGLSNKAIANALGISEGTVRKAYVSELLRLFQVTRRTELMIEVARRRIRFPPELAQGRAMRR